MSEFDAQRSAAEIVKFEAEAEAAKASARKLAAEARAAEVDALRAELEFGRERARDEYNHVYRFDESVSSSSVKHCISKLSEWARLDPGCDITIAFNSPGGSVIDGMALWDFLASLKAQGHHLTTVARGMAASMAAILLQAGDHRVIGRESYMLIHEVSFGAGGKIGEVEDEVAFAKKITDRVLDIFAERSNLSRTQIKNRWSRRDWWLDSRDSLANGFVDEIA